GHPRGRDPDEGAHLKDRASAGGAHEHREQASELRGGHHLGPRISGVLPVELLERRRRSEQVVDVGAEARIDLQPLEAHDALDALSRPVTANVASTASSTPTASSAGPSSDQAAPVSSAPREASMTKVMGFQSATALSQPRSA